MDRNAILSLLKEGDMTYADFREKGHYPRKELGLLQESEIVEKLIIGGKVKWHLKEQFGEKEMEEITEGLEKAISLMEEYLPENTNKITIETETKDNDVGIPTTHRSVTFELEKPAVPPFMIQTYPTETAEIKPSISMMAELDTATQPDGIVIDTTTSTVFGNTKVVEVEEPKVKKHWWQK